jgi:hypothetical protein
MDASVDSANTAATAADPAGAGGVPGTAARRTRRRGASPKRAVTLADSLSRLAAAELVALGVPATTAAAATRHLTEEDWARVVAGGGDGRRLFLVAEAAGDGGAPAVTVVDEAEIGEHLGRGALAVDLTGVAEVALARLNALLAMP